MRKAIMVVLTAAVLVLMFVPSVFADDGQHFSLGSCSIKDPDGTWVDVTSRTSYSALSNYAYIKSWKPSDVSVMYGLRFSLVPAGYVQVDPGYYYNFSFTYTGDVLNSSDLDAHLDDFSLTFNLSDGTQRVVKPYSSNLRPKESGSNTYIWDAAFSLYIGDGVPVRVDGIVFETSFPGNTSSSYVVTIYSSVTPEPTPELQRHLELMQKIQEIFTGLKDEIAAQTEAILGESYDYTDPSDKGSSDASIAGLAEQLAGLSDQINQSVSDFRSSIDGLTDHINAGKAFIWGWLDYVPAWFTGIVTGFAGLLIARKIVK